MLHLRDHFLVDFKEQPGKIEDVKASKLKSILSIKDSKLDLKEQPGKIEDVKASKLKSILTMKDSKVEKKQEPTKYKSYFS